MAYPRMVLCCVQCVQGRRVSGLLVSLPQITDLTSELADERFKGDMACQALENEQAQRLQALREVQELKVRGHGDLVGGHKWFVLVTRTSAEPASPSEIHPLIDFCVLAPGWAFLRQGLRGTVDSDLSNGGYV